jgi:hypothetical protein
MGAEVTFGFLANNDVLEATLPDEFVGRREAYSVVLFEGTPITVMWADAEGARRVVEDPALGRLRARGGAHAEIVVYGPERPEGMDPDFTLLTFAPVDGPPMTGRMWVVLDSMIDARRAEEAFASGLIPVVDEHGLPHFAVEPPLRLGSIRDPVQRDGVTFFTKMRDDGYSESLRFTESAAFGTDGNRVVGDTCLVTVTTPIGVSITCDGAASAAKSLEERAGEIAASLRRFSADQRG